MTNLMFDEAYESIIDAYYNILEAERTKTGGLITKSGGLIEDTNTIVRGDRIRGRPEAPAVWIFPMLAVNNQSMTIKEDWTVPVQLVAVVEDDDPVSGYYAAFKLASRSRSTILKDRSLGLNFVNDTISNSFDRTDPPNKRKNLYAHFALLWTNFWVLED